jgi:aspartate kinase
MTPQMSPSLTVAKFGGTSMGNAEAMLQAAQIALSNPKTRLVVVSATSGTTNQLLEVSQFIQSQQPKKAAALVETLFAKHLKIANELALNPSELSPLFDELRNPLTQGGQEKNEAEFLDHLLSFGERISSVLFSQALRKSGGNSSVFDVRKVLRTDSSFGKAEPQPSEIEKLCHQHLQPLLEKEVIVAQGFIGSDAQGRTTTLGRGGSDYSAALLAEGLHADEVQIWTDVNGIFTMDPNAVPKAFRIENISFSEATELANFGAKVLHPATLWPAVRKQIRVFIGSTFQPKGGGTWIHSEISERPLIRAIAVRKNQTLITVTSLRMLNTHGYLARLFSILAKHQLSVDLVTTSEVSVALTIDGTSLGSSGKKIVENQKLLKELAEIAEVEIEEGLSLVALVGNRITTTPGISAKAFSAVQDFNLRLICHGASSHNLCFLVKGEQAAAVAQRLHQTFVE